MLRMSLQKVIKIILLLLLICCSFIAAKAATLNENWVNKHRNLWVALSSEFTLEQSALTHKAYIDVLQALKKDQYYLSELTENAEPYVYYVLQQTRKRAMPAELALLPMVESAYNPFAYSRRGATGLWQLMPGTASGFGLKINWWYDGRRDIVASTNAALNYLQYLHDYFHDWLLAIAAYDSGEGTVLAAIRRNRLLHRPTDFWSLPLPRETRLYVPKLLALAQVIKHAQLYGLRLSPVAYQAIFTSITLNSKINLQKLAKLSHSPVSTIRRLNPAFRRAETGPNEPVHLLLPVSKADILANKLSKITQDHLYPKLIRHRVQAGESLILIAKCFHSSVAQLRISNRLKNDLLPIGKDLLIPVSYYSSVHRVGNPLNQDSKFKSGLERIEYTVKIHDNVSRIAHHFHVTIRQIFFWNNFNRHTILLPKQTLILWKPRHYFYRRMRKKYYRIKLGDTLSQIAFHFSTTTRRLRVLNQLHCNKIYAGQHLLVP